MFNLALYALMILSVYGCYVMGLIAHCDAFEELKYAKKYVFIVPFLNPSLFVMFMIEAVRSRKMGILKDYIHLPNKSLRIMFAIDAWIPEYRRSKQLSRLDRAYNSQHSSSSGTMLGLVRIILGSELFSKASF